MRKLMMATMAGLLLAVTAQAEETDPRPGAGIPSDVPPKQERNETRLPEARMGRPAETARPSPVPGAEPVDQTGREPTGPGD